MDRKASWLVAGAAALVAVSLAAALIVAALQDRRLTDLLQWAAIMLTAAALAFAARGGSK